MTNISLQKDIIHQLLYSEVFRYPMTLEELSLCHNREEVKQALDELLADDLIHTQQDFYYVFDESDKISRRIRGNKNAEKAMPKALKIARFIYSFPFVEGVGISGSLSKGVLDQEGDFDYFIITRPDRLWIARTLLILYKKIFLLNSRKTFCVNYFIDSDHLKIEERNLFTATEIATLIPVCGSAISDFQAANDWIREYGKDYTLKAPNLPGIKKRGMAALLQHLFKGRLGEWVDTYCMRRTLRYWKGKFPGFSSEKFDLTMKSRRYVSKHHPNDFQNKVLTRFADLQQQYYDNYKNAELIPEVLNK